MFSPAVFRYGDEHQYRAVCQLDPLQADALCAQLPRMNATRDVAAIIDLLRRLHAAIPPTYFDSLPERLAAMRDLGIVLGSLKRHGVEPADVAPEVVPALLRLGAETAMVPRDTIFHYTIWNPDLPRRRTYTEDVQEVHLQESVRLVFPWLPQALERCDVLGSLDPHQHTFATELRYLAESLQPLVDSMLYVARTVTPSFFTHELRPYLEPVRIGDDMYLGPAAAQLPVWLVDEMLWSRGPEEPEYESFWLTLVPYSLPRWRQLHDRWRSGPTITDRVVEALELTSRPDHAVRSAAQALVQVLRIIVSFRGRHLGIAQRSYEDQNGDYTVGSGGGSIELLRQIIDLTKAGARRPRQRSSGSDHDRRTDTDQHEARQ